MPNPVRGDVYVDKGDVDLSRRSRETAEKIPNEVILSMKQSDDKSIFFLLSTPLEYIRSK
jgi:hypothetical protein